MVARPRVRSAYHGNKRRLSTARLRAARRARSAEATGQEAGRAQEAEAAGSDKNHGAQSAPLGEDADGCRTAPDPGKQSESTTVDAAGHGSHSAPAGPTCRAAAAAAKSHPGPFPVPGNSARRPATAGHHPTAGRGAAAVGSRRAYATAVTAATRIAAADSSTVAGSHRPG